MTISLSPRQRLALIRHINRFVQPDFEQLVFVLDAPNSVIPSNVAAQGDRAIALINWINSPVGCGMDEFLHVLANLAPLPTELKSLVTPAPAVRPSPPTPSPQPVPVAPFKPEKHIEIELLNGVTLVFMHIPAGVFFMGSPEDEDERYENEGPQHKVKVPAFYMAQCPVTQAQWHAVSLMDDIDMALPPDPSNFKGDDRPVEQVSWHEAIEFSKRLSRHIQQQGRYAGQVCRLPSEAEWEYACRANTRTRYYFGNDITPKQVNYYETVEETTPVGQYPSNDFGLYDMHGNVWEWCLDHWHENYEGAPTDGSAWLENTPQSNNRRVWRGGSWIDRPRYCRSAFRDRSTPDARFNHLGFRVVLAPQ